tara:strand:- start:1184 stop:3067 length:1884 start_codon:yes stop_codon:yes gene_type:complete
MDQYQQYIALSKYARFVEGEERRETWGESVDRYINFFSEKFPQAKKDLAEASGYIKSLAVVPSMRAIMTAGPALDRDHIAGYNCSYLAINDQRAFDETLYLLMCGTGVGYSVERANTEQLPTVPLKLKPSDDLIVVEDSKIGWAEGLRELITALYNGEVPQWDLGKIRPSGSRLKVFGGRASGPDPLEKLFKFTIKTFREAEGRRLKPLECHDILCAVAASVVVGGVRRSAMISLSDLDDDEMRYCKSGEWWEYNIDRKFANNSVAYEKKPDMGEFLNEWTALYKSQSGERGIFNRQAAMDQATKSGRRDPNHAFGTNPCGEILLRDMQTCNLSEVIIRASDDEELLTKKVEIAALLGTLQSALTDTRYLRPEWKKNMMEERLLGVSFTGIMDNPLMYSIDSYDATFLSWRLERMKEVVIKTNEKWASILGINPSVATTCVKPSGTVSQLSSSASGIHPRYANHYIRRVRADIKDPLATWMADQGLPNELDKHQEDNLVFSFPIKSPAGCVTRHSMTAMDQLNLWMIYRKHWTEHNPSITVYVSEDEWIEVADYVYQNFEEVGGVSFLPREDDKHTYVQAPYEEINELQYADFMGKMPSVSFSAYREAKDMTVASQELACTGGACEL